MLWPCLVLACRGLGMPWLGLGIAPHSRHSERVRLLEAWHACPLHAACAHHARSMRASCTKHARSMPKISTKFLKPRSCHGLLCLALPCHAQDVAYTKLFKPCLASPLPCVALACRAHGLDMPCPWLCLAL
ncbi:unnamed protein product [Prunus brigantina]